MAWNSSLCNWELCFKWILLCTLFQHSISFTLEFKSIYLLYGDNTTNVDNTFPFQQGEIGEVGGREGSVAFTDSNGDPWIFGGRGSDDSYWNDLWKFSDGMWYWMGVNSGANDPGFYNATGLQGVPPCRASPAYWIDEVGDFWIFGGRTYLDPVAGVVPVNDMWRYSFTTSTWTWIYGDQANLTQLPPRDDGPSRRSRAASWVQGTKFYLFGGLLADMNATNDLWEFDTQTLNWTLVSGDQPGSYVTNGGYPPARSGATVAVDTAGAWIFGGKTSDGHYLSDMWRYTTYWQWVGGPSTPDSPGSYPTSLGDSGSPPAREGACSWYDAEGYLWIYAGSNGTSYYGDFWRAPQQTPGQILDFHWAGTSSVPEFPQINNQGGPGLRAFAAYWQDTIGDLFFFSGSSSFRNDVWVLDMDDCTYNNGGCITNCTNLIGKPYQCSPCPPGTQGDGFNCTDIDECHIKPNGGCDPLTNCTNNLNGAPPNCSECPPGYLGNGTVGCTLIDPCTLPPGMGGCDKHVTCNFTGPGSPAICGPCPFGFNGTGNTSCVDFDECSVNNGGCDPLTNCTNNEGALATCSDCPGPYYKGNGAKPCQDVNECSTNNGGCDLLTACTNNIGGPPTCGPCPLYYDGTGETKCTDIDECAKDNGDCPPQSVCTNNIGGPPTCGPCINGFIGNNYCSSGSHGSKNAGLIAGVTIGGFVVLLIVIGLIFHFTKGKNSKSPSSVRLSQSAESAQRFELKALSEA